MMGEFTSQSMSHVNHVSCTIPDTVDLINKRLWIKCMTVGDGHCLLHALRISWFHQIAKSSVPSYEEIRMKIFEETITSSARYKPFLNESESLIHQTHQYLLQKHFNSTYGDIVPYILANGLSIELYIIDESNSLQVTHVVPEVADAAQRLLIHRDRDHYSGICFLPNSPAFQCTAMGPGHDVYSPVELGKSAVSASSAWITYRSDEIRSLQCSDTSVSRKIRKRLFHLRIWRPRKSITSSIPVRVTYRNKAHLTTSSRVCHQNLRTLSLTETDNICKKSRDFNLSVCCLNTQSVVNKAESLCDFITTYDFDIIALTETWVKNDTPSAVMCDLIPQGYSIKQLPRPGQRRGGGVALIYRSSIQVSCKHSAVAYQSFEHLDCEISTKFKNFTLSVIYRPPPSNVNGLSVGTFLDEWSTYLASKAISPSSPILTGDLNFHIDVSQDADASRFLHTICTAGFKQHVVGPTHNKGHTLDVVLTLENDSIINHINVIDHGICDRHGNPVCDHKAINFHLNVSKPPPVRCTVSFRRLKQISVPNFKADLQNVRFSNETDANTICKVYNSTIQALINKHAPSITKKIILRPNTPYFTDEVRKAKQLKKKLERIWRHTKSDNDHQIYRAACGRANKILRQEKLCYFSNKVIECGNNQKALFSITNCLLKNVCSPQLPPHESSVDLANKFAEYFGCKVLSIRNSLPLSSIEEAEPRKFPSTSKVLSTFQGFTESDIKNIILKSPPKSCNLDPMPTWLLKECLENSHFLSVVSHIINACVTGTMPSCMKEAVVRPLLKKPTLDNSNFKNYRPISNLPFLSKIIEKVIAHQLKKHLGDNQLLDTLQSAYRECHSTETALLKVQSDILDAIDHNSAAVLILLDLSAAFDTIDHAILLQRLKNSFNIKGQALAWLCSYLTGRNQIVEIDGKKSSHHPLNFGVPQGSVLGPLLFTCYTTPVGEIINSHGMMRHFYADDTQLYISFKPPLETNYAIKSIEACISSIRIWMQKNYLKLNDDKTEMLVFNTKQKLPLLKTLELQIGDTTISPSPTAKNLGVTFDSCMTMDRHISNMCKSSYYQIRNIAYIRRYLTIAAVKTLVQACVTSRLDYANCVLYGLPKATLNRLQCIQNMSARVIARSRRSSHITPVLIQLHWLPVPYRVTYKVLIMTYKAIHGLTPNYIQDMISIYEPSRTLRSSSEVLLNTPRARLKTWGDRTFQFASATEWNKLPVAIRNCQTLIMFKSRLKTHLFKLAFNI